MNALTCLILAPLLVASEGPPVRVNAVRTCENNTQSVVTITFRPQPGVMLYADSVRVASPSGSNTLRQASPARTRRDDILEKDVQVYDGEATFAYVFSVFPTDSLTVVVHYQACSSTVCYPPERVELTFQGEGDGYTGAPRVPELSGDIAEHTALKAFSLVARHSGYLSPRAFLRFLDAVEEGRAGRPDRLEALVATGRLATMLFLIVLGGLALNLTPCVLPLIPVHLAILGAGALAHGSRNSGFWRGTVYGAGMTIAYGTIGTVVIIAGGQFGSFHASPLFNVAIAAVFLILALAMFGIIPLDLSRFQPRVASGRHGLLAAFGWGALAALLAGSCVAPMLMSVLVLGASLYGQGHRIALVMPFALGLGMALPWPLIGGGISLLPTPGRWMVAVKTVFGVVILGFAIRYAWLGVQLFRGDRPVFGGGKRVPAKDASEANWVTDWSSALAVSRRENRPVFIVFETTWCASCRAMKQKTFRDPDVQRRLKRYITVRFLADRPEEPAIRAVLDHLRVSGFPTCVVLRPSLLPTEGMHREGPSSG